jgi:hypothetical protein
MFGLTIDLPSGLGTDDAAASERTDCPDRGERTRERAATGGEAGSDRRARSDGAGTLRGDDRRLVRTDDPRPVRDDERDCVVDGRERGERTSVDESVRLFVAWVACWAGA